MTSHRIRTHHAPRVAVIFTAIVLLQTAVAFALDPRVPLSQYGRRVWTADQGLPPTAVQAIAQTNDGYIWVGTQEGIGRFDGVRFRMFFDWPQRESWIHSMSVDRDGTLWVAANGALFSLKGDELVREDKVEAVRWGSIYSIASARDGSIFLGTGGLQVIRRASDGTLRVWGKSEGISAPVRALEPGRDGAMWIGTETGILRIVGDRLTRVGEADGFKRPARALFEDEAHRLWIGSTDGVYLLENERISIPPSVFDLAGSLVHDIHEDSGHTLWFTTTNGLKRISPGGATAAPSNETFGGVPQVLFEDREGILWVGTSRTLEQLRDTLFKNFGTQQGLSYDGMFSVAEARDGAMWFATASGLGRLREGRVRWFRRADGLPNEMVIAVAPARRGGVWVGTYGGGFCHAGETISRCWGLKDGLAHGVVSSFVETADRLWIGTLGGGLYSLTNGTIANHYAATTGIESRRISAMAPARDGGVWIGTLGFGTALFRNGRVSRVIDAKEPSIVRALLEEKDGTLWLGDEARGLSVVLGTRLVKIPLSRWMNNIRVHSIVADDRGGLWVVAAHRILRFEKAELLRYAKDAATPLHPALFGTMDGLQSSSFPAGGPGAIRASDGSLWFATSRGAAHLDPALLKQRRKIAPSVLIESATADDRVLARSGGTVSGRGVRLVFRYTATLFTAADDLHFRYKLEGYDDHWIDAGTTRQAVYTNLPPGKFTFRVFAAAGGDWKGAAGSTFSFERTPTITETIWFRVLCVSAIALLVAAAVHARLRVLARRELVLSRRVDEKTSELRDANEQLAESKQIAEEAAALNAQLSHQKQRILNSTADGIVELDARGHATFVNDAAARLLGYSVDQLTGRRFHDTIHDRGDEAIGDQECTTCCARRSDARTEGNAVFLTSAGTRMPVEYTTTAESSAGGALDHVVITFRDVTERRAVEKMKSEFVSTVSHELRTPLTSMRGALGLLGSGIVGSIDSRGQKMLDIAIRNTDRLVRLINDILDLERMDSGTIELDRTMTDVHTLMIHAAEGVQSMADAAGVSVKIKAIDQSLSVDSDRILQTLTNLLSNAIKFSPREGTITMAGAVTDSEFVFRVEDQGRGVPPEKLGMIFERFQQVETSDSRDKGGTGLGLAICHNIVRSHGGRIWAESDGRSGTVFQFTIPLPPAEEKCADESASAAVA